MSNFDCFLQRPTAKELLKHRFVVRNSKKPAILVDLIDKYRRWQTEKGHSAGNGATQDEDQTDEIADDGKSQKYAKR